MHVLGVPVVVNQPEPSNGLTQSQPLTSVKLHLNLLFIVLQEERLKTISKSVTADIGKC
jgi:hypothetical protein